MTLWLRRAGGQLPLLVAEAASELRSHWRGQVLTLVGLVWGSAALILLLSVGTAFNRFLDLGVETSGSRWLRVSGDFASLEGSVRQAGRAIVLTLDDVERVQSSAPSAAVVTGEVVEMVAVETPRLTRATVVSAAGHEVKEIQNHELAAGRWFTEDEDESGSQVVVLGHGLVERFFDSGSPLGRDLRIGAVSFRVIGVMKPKGVQLYTYMALHDDMLFVPLTAGQRVLRAGRREVDHILANPYRIDEMDRLKREVRHVVWVQHHLKEEEPRAVVFRSIVEIMEPAQRAGMALNLVLGLVGTFTLAMAAIGVANLMVALVNVRKRDFAMRRACGARRSDILLQLVVETSLVVLAGGAVGMAAGTGMILALASVDLPPEIPQPSIQPSVLFTTFVVLVATAIASSVVPAKRAANVDPSIALRDL